MNRITGTRGADEPKMIRRSDDGGDAAAGRHRSRNRRGGGNRDDRHQKAELCRDRARHLGRRQLRQRMGPGLLRQTGGGQEKQDRRSLPVGRLRQWRDLGHHQSVLRREIRGGNRQEGRGRSRGEQALEQGVRGQRHRVGRLQGADHPHQGQVQRRTRFHGGISRILRRGLRPRVADQGGRCRRAEVQHHGRRLFRQFAPSLPRVSSEGSAE